MENPKANEEEKKSNFLGTFGIIKSALITIPFKDLRFIADTFVISLPLFTAMVIDELFITPFSLEKISLPPKINVDESIRILFNKLQSDDFIQPNLLLQMFFWDLFSLILKITTIYSASMIYSGGRYTNLRNSFTKSRWRDPLVVAIYITALNYILQIVKSFWTFTTPLLTSINPLFVFIWCVIALVIFVKELEYKARWSVGLVVAILEEKNGFEAMLRSEKLVKGNVFRGLVLMYMLFCWRIITIFLTRDKQGSFDVKLGYALLLQNSLLCIGKVVKCLVTMVYYYDCRRIHGEKVELQKVIKSESQLLQNSNPT